jgi:ABC-type polysaccharide/polyol phosphate export permease
LAVTFRDVVHFMTILLQVWFWGTPILYSLDYVRAYPTMQFILKLNPMTGPIVGLRNVMLLDRPPSGLVLAYDLVASLAVLALGGLVFRRQQRLFPELV